MAISMSSVALTTCTRMLSNLEVILRKGEQFAQTKPCAPEALTQSRLSPDMFPLTPQVQIACDGAKNGVARLAGIEAPAFEDNETTFPQLIERVQKTLAFLATVPAASVDGTEAKEVTFPAGPGKTRTMHGEAYLVTWVLPNLYFHITTAYGLLRHNGVNVGKIDFLMGAPA